jgi:hypothetical protein
MNDDLESNSITVCAKRFLFDGLAVIPAFVPDQGEISTLFFRDKQQLVPYGSKRFVNELCRLLFRDLKSLQAYSRQKLNKQQMTPVPLDFHLVLTPLRSGQQEIKTRNFIWLSYRAVKEIHSIASSPTRTKVVLINGDSFFIAHSAEFLHHQLRDACFIEMLFSEEHLIPHPQRPTLPRYAKDSSHPLHHPLMLIAEAFRNYF